MGIRKYKLYSNASRLFLMGLLYFLFIVYISPNKAWSGQAWENEDIANTKHNLSSVGPAYRTVKSNNINDICVFCHTPHASQNDGPIWNRKFSQSSYTMYQPQININAPGTISAQSFKGSLDSTISTNPTGYSKLCLSCHDGSIAINKVLNKTGSGGYNSAGSLLGTMSGTGAGGVMPEGSGEFTGDTRRLGTDLSNDHPISFRMDQQTVINIDKELSKPDDCGKNNFHYGCNEPNWTKKQGIRLYPLDFNSPFKDAVQCTSCHNPHTTNEKFLRANKYNLNQGVTTNRTQICEACHPKPGWVGSTHENAFFGFKYRDNPKQAQELDGKTVSQHGCINCHDPHTIQGADRLHRNGAGKPGDTYGAGNAGAGGKTPAIENTCYQCHLDKNASVPNLGTVINFLDGSLGPMFYAPDIKSVFDKNTTSPASGYKEMDGNGSSMPLDRSWSAPNPGDTNGIHQPVFVSEETIINRQDFHGSDNMEENVLNRPKADEFIHVECVDCHNPHQVDTKNRMKGMKGVRLDGTIIGGDSGIQPITGMPGTANGPLGGSIAPYNDDRGPGDTRGVPKRNGTADLDPITQRYEPLVYEICLRCHGDSFSHNMPFKAYGATPGIGGPSRPERNRGHLTTSPLGPQFGSSNKRLEFDPSSHGRSWTPAGGFNDSLFSYNPAYHPVAAPGRNGTVALYNQLRVAFNLGPSYLTDTAGNRTIAANALSTLTIQCTDCHNNSDLSTSNLDFASADGPFGPITGVPDNPGTGMYAYRRSTDRESANLNNTYSTSMAYTINPSRAQGPHGSVNHRILRAPYKTRFNPNRSPGSTMGDLLGNFGLCFQCHESRIFLNGAGFSSGKGTNFGADFRNLGSGGFTSGRFAWSNNLHYYHLSFTGAYCHECHNNVHSNIEADNSIYGDGLGGFLPDDAHDGIDDGYIDTHLINFGPQASGDNAAIPNWYYDASLGQFRCNLQCHGITMTACAYYTHSSSFGPFGSHNGWTCGSQGTPF